MTQKSVMLKINKLQKQIKYYTTMTEIKTIALSKETADLLEAKKNLDECYAKLGKVQDKLFGYDKEFEDKVGCAYATINEAIMRIMADSIDTTSTESQYKVI